MTQHEEKNIQEEKDIVEEMEQEIEGIEDEEGAIDEEKLDAAIHGDDEPQVAKLKDALARSQADFDNFKKRTDRDREEMIFFLKSDIFKKVLPRVDDLERIIKNTPEDMKQGALFEGVVSMQSKLLQDLEKMGVHPFDSIGSEVDPHKHDVMTQVPWGEDGIIIDEFEKGYMLGEKVLRHAKVVVGTGA